MLRHEDGSDLLLLLLLHLPKDQLAVSLLLPLEVSVALTTINMEQVVTGHIFIAACFLENINCL